MKKPNLIEVMFKDKSKFGLLITQLLITKKKEKEILRVLDQAPSTKDLDLKKDFAI